MIELKIDSHSVKIYKSDYLTSGSVGLLVKIMFCSEEWNDLTPIVKFMVEDMSYTSIDQNGLVVVPWELLVADNVGKRLQFGICGLNGTSIVFPTMYADLGEIKLGADTTGENSEPPTPAAYELLIAHIDEASATAQSASDLAVTSSEIAMNSKEIAESASEAALVAASQALESATTASSAMDTATIARDSATASAAAASQSSVSAVSSAGQAANSAASAFSYSDQASLDAATARTNASKAAALSQTATTKAAEAAASAFEAAQYLEQIKELISQLS